MEDYTAGIFKLTQTNNFFRQVIKTGEKMQVVLMSLQPGEDIGSEVHPETEQIIIAVKGEGKVVLNGADGPFTEGDMVVVRPGTEHNFINSSKNEMKILTIYAPPHHADGAIHETKEIADEAEGSE